MKQEVRTAVFFQLLFFISITHVARVTLSLERICNIVQLSLKPTWHSTRNDIELIIEMINISCDFINYFGKGTRSTKRCLKTLMEKVPKKHACKHMQ